MFKHLRVNGEWFRVTDELSWFIRTLHNYPELRNIRDIQVKSMQSRLKHKVKRLGKNHKLTQRINSYGVV